MRKSGKTKCDSLLLELTRLLDSGAYTPHQRFFSVQKLMQQYCVSQATVVTVLQWLEQEGRLYRKPGSGTYVSPPQKIRQVLLVARIDRLDSTQVNRFARGIETNIPERLNCRTTFVTAEEFLANFPDFELHYRNVAAVVFIWAPELFLQCSEKLTALKILHLFYGSMINREVLGENNCFFFNDKEIIDSALDRLYAAGHRKIGCVYGEGKTLYGRYQYYLDWMKAHDLPVIPQGVMFEKEKGDCCKILQRQEKTVCTAFLAISSELFLEVLTTFQQKKISVPEEVSLLSIELSHLYRYIVPAPLSLYIDHQGNGKRIIRLIDAAIAAGTLTIPNEYGEHFWYEGDTLAVLQKK